MTEPSYFILDQLSTCKESPLRRSSWSAPARLSIGRLEQATQNLGKRVLSLSKLASRPSNGVDLSPDQSPGLAKSVVRPVADTMGRTCHGCHAPLDDDHQAYPSGWQKCQLEHWDGCQGGIADGKAAN